MRIRCRVRMSGNPANEETDMQTKPKSNSVITTAQRDGGNGLTVLVFTVKDVGELTLDMGKLSAKVITRAAVHGLTQRISDAAAISRNTETGKSASPLDKFNAMKALCEWYETGTEEWTRKRAVGTGAGSGSGYSNGLLEEALKRVYPGKSEERIREYVKGLKASERLGLLGSDKIRPVVEEIQREMAKDTKVDADALLAGLEEDEGASREG